MCSIPPVVKNSNLSDNNPLKGASGVHKPPTVE
jgi:hypothetical protein